MPTGCSQLVRGFVGLRSVPILLSRLRQKQPYYGNNTTLTVSVQTDSKEIDYSNAAQLV